MFVDHRTYDFQPGKIECWLEAYRDARQAGAGPAARPVAALHGHRMRADQPGGLPWAYSSLGDRDRRRTAMAADPAWAEFPKATGGARRAEGSRPRMVLKPVTFSPIR